MESGLGKQTDLRELPRELNDLGERIIGAAIEVHRALGPGLLEKLYEEALVHELKLRGTRAERQVPVSFSYKDVELIGQRIDLVVEGAVVVELKAVDCVVDAFFAQLLGYLRAGNYPLGLLINFNVPVLIRGVSRRVNSRALQSSSPPSRSAASA
jgi:GxxExxY protein